MRLRLHLVLIPAVVTLAACGGGDSTSPSGTSSTPTTPTTPTTPSNTAPTQTNAVSVGDNFFSPSAIQVSPGTTVTWTWPSGTSTHNVTFSDGTTSGDKSAGSVFTRTFNSAGTFTYVCTLHGGMNGSVLVK